MKNLEDCVDCSDTTNLQSPTHFFSKSAKGKYIRYPIYLKYHVILMTNARQTMRAVLNLPPDYPDLRCHPERSEGSEPCLCCSPLSQMLRLRLSMTTWENTLPQFPFFNLRFSLPSDALSLTIPKCERSSRNVDLAITQSVWE